MQERPSGDLKTRTILVLMVSLRRNDAVQDKKEPRSGARAKAYILD
jgi:hypothetical protein